MKKEKVLERFLDDVLLTAQKVDIPNPELLEGKSYPLLSLKKDRDLGEIRFQVECGKVRVFSTLLESSYTRTLELFEQIQLFDILDLACSSKIDTFEELLNEAILSATLEKLPSEPAKELTHSLDQIQERVVERYKNYTALKAVERRFELELNEARLRHQFFTVLLLLVSLSHIFLKGNGPTLETFLTLLNIGTFVTFLWSGEIAGILAEDVNIVRILVSGTDYSDARASTAFPETKSVELFVGTVSLISSKSRRDRFLELYQFQKELISGRFSFEYCLDW